MIYRDPVERFLSALNYLYGGGNQSGFGVFSDKNMSDSLREFNLLGEHEKKQYILSLYKTNRMFWPLEKFVTVNGRLIVTNFIDLDSVEAQEIFSGKRGNASKGETELEISESLLNYIRELYASDYEYIKYLE